MTMPRTGPHHVTHCGLSPLQAAPLGCATLRGLCWVGSVRHSSRMTPDDHAPLCSQLVSENADASDIGNEGRPDPEAPAATNYFLQYISSRWAVTFISLHGGMLGDLPETPSRPQPCLLGADV